MFNDLKERAKLKANVVATQNNRKEEVKWLFRSVVEEALPEMESLGFFGVKLHKYDSIPAFHLRLQTRRSYSSSNHTHNLELASIENKINYGSGANSSKGKQIEFDYSWNDSKLVATMKHALRAIVGEALTSLEHANVKGWNDLPGQPSLKTS